MSNIASYYGVKSEALRRHYKDRVGGFKEWDQISHAGEYLVYPGNITSQLSIDEVALSKGELYTVVTNKRTGEMNKKCLVAIINGTDARVIQEVLGKHPPNPIFSFQSRALNFGDMKEESNWAVLIEAYNLSGLSQREFCLQKNVDLEQFKWRLRLSRKKANPAGDFLQVSVCRPEPSPLGVELHFPDGLFLRFAGQVGTDYLRDLIAGLRP